MLTVTAGEAHQAAEPALSVADSNLRASDNL
jgi:hypothetical protein